MNTETSGGDSGGFIEDLAHDFLEVYCQDELAAVAQGAADVLRVDYGDLFQWDPDYAEQVRTDPASQREYFEEAANAVEIAGVSLSDPRVRFTGVATEGFVYDVGAYEASEDIGSLIRVDGQVNKKSQKRPHPVTAAYECQRCGIITEVPGDQQPHECHGCERQGPFQLQESESEFIDTQTIRLQRPPEKNPEQSNEEVDVELQADLVNSVTPGDRVRMDAILDIEELGNGDGYRYTATAEDVEISETDFEDFDITDEQIEEIEAIANGEPFDQLVKSIAPEIYGLDHIKLAIALQLFGGIRKEYPDGSVTRGDSHILLVGDPGVGKSDLLTYADQVAPRSVYSDGKGSSAAGITAAAVRDDFGSSEWTIEGGAVVQAHRGLAALDELDDMDPDDRSALHTVLEKQTVDVAKAGMTASLPAQTRLLAAANPKHGRFDPYEPVHDEVDLDPALISRFDLIFTVQDRPDRERDTNISEHKLDRAEYGQRRNSGGDVPEDIQNDQDPPIPKELFRAYIAHARQNVAPVFTDTAKEKLKSEFVDLRFANGEVDDDERSPMPTTYRKLDGLIRLAEASARIRLSEEIELEDALRALELVRQSMEDVEMDPDTGEFDADIVETGVSMSQQKRIKTVKDLVSECESLEISGAPLEELVERVEATGLSEQELLETIKTLKDKGEIFEPKKNHYELTD